MNKITFECETITPMFCYGADGITPEIRAPSFKGAMRFWWRAVNGHLPIGELRKKEAEIFGGIGENKGKSKIWINIVSNINDLCETRPLPHSKDKKKNFKLKAIKPKNNFTIVFLMKREFDVTDTITIDLFYIKNLFILLSILGGIGRRARRGFGSFRIIKVNESEFQYDPYLSLKKVKVLLKAINLNSKDHFDINNKTIVSDFNSNTYPYIKKIQFGKEGNEEYKLLCKIGNASHKNDSDYTGFAKGRERLSSPIYVSIAKNDNKFLPVITTLETVFKDNKSNHNKDKSGDFIEEVLL